MNIPKEISFQISFLPILMEFLVTFLKFHSENDVLEVSFEFDAIY